MSYTVHFLFISLQILPFYRDIDSGGLRDISFVMNGINIWKNALINGHLPEFNFNQLNSENSENNGNFEEYSSSAIWPDKLLSDELCNVCTSLDLPFLTSRHPELVPSVLKSLLEISINYSKRIVERNKKIQEDDETTNKVEDVDDPNYWEDNMYEDNLNGEQEDKDQQNGKI